MIGHILPTIQQAANYKNKIVVSANYFGYYICMTMHPSNVIQSACKTFCGRRVILFITAFIKHLE